MFKKKVKEEYIWNNCIVMCFRRSFLLPLIKPFWQGGSFTFLPLCSGFKKWLYENQKLDLKLLLKYADACADNAHVLCQFCMCLKAVWIIIIFCTFLCMYDTTLPLLLYNQLNIEIMEIQNWVDTLPIYYTTNYKLILVNIVKYNMFLILCKTFKWSILWSKMF